jgi:hypothetical protein
MQQQNVKLFAPPLKYQSITSESKFTILKLPPISSFEDQALNTFQS